MKENTHLDNRNGSTQSSVRLNAPSTPQVTLIFPRKGNPKVREDMASALLAVFTKMQGSKEQ